MFGEYIYIPFKNYKNLLTSIFKIITKTYKIFKCEDSNLLGCYLSGDKLHGNPIKFSKVM